MIGNILGNIIKGMAPLALDMGSQIIKTKLEENAMKECEKKIFNQALGVVTNCVIAGIEESNKYEEPKPSVQMVYMPQEEKVRQQYRLDNCIAIEDTSRYKFELRDFQ